MVDLERLEKEIEKLKIAKRDLAKKAGVSESSLYRKLNGESKFYCEEVKRIICAIGMDRTTAIEIFFKEE